LLVVDNCPVVDEPVGQRVHRCISVTDAHLALDQSPSAAFGVHHTFSLTSA
jgi:hypothetical protein